jgi:DNA-binding PadR family transcriptional regulator
MHGRLPLVKLVPLHHALLSLLADGENYGYELKGAFERSVGPQWGALNIGHLYQVLDRLKRDGLVEAVRAEPQPRRPDRLIYAITDAGRAELRRWLDTPSPPAAGYRDELYLKLVAAARAGEDALVGVIRGERHALLAELHALRGLAGADDDFAALLTEGAALHVEARLRLLDLAEADAAALGAAASAPTHATKSTSPAKQIEQHRPSGLPAMASSGGVARRVRRSAGS